MTVEHELIKATGIGKAGGEPRRAFLKRLLKSIDEAVKATPDLWAELSEPARDWVNDASVKHNAQEPLPEFQDSEEVGAMTVEHELIKATGIGKAGGERRQAFLKRLLKSVDEAIKAAPDLWGELSETARDWLNYASVKHNEQKPIPEFQDSEEVGERAVPPKQKPTASAKLAPASKEHWSDLTSHKVDVGRVDVGDRIIAPTQKRVADMIKSLEKAGQINPIQITKGHGDSWKLVTGAARLAAAKKLGWHQIKATVIGADNPFDLKLIEIEENLGRHDLTNAERKRLTAMEKKLRAQRDAHFEDLIKNPPQAVIGKPPKRRHRATGGPKGRPQGGAAADARKAGIPERTGQRKARAFFRQNEDGGKKPARRTKKCPMCHGTGRVKR